MQRIKIENTPGWEKDPTSKAILNSDLTALEQRKLNKVKNIQLNSIESDITTLKQEIIELKSQIKDIKNILQQSINI